MYLIDRFAGLDHKTTVDAGVSWKVLTTAAQALALDAGAGVTHEARRDTADRTFGIGTLGASYGWHFTRRNAVTERLLFTGALEDASNWRLSSAAALTVAMTRVLAIKLTHELQYVHEPVPGFRPTDTRLSAALVVKF
jgi:putative salt-induced outer membrane protein YdiY